MKVKRLFLFMFVFVSGCATFYDPATGPGEFYFINDRQETAIGKSIANNIIKKNKFIKDEKKLSYVRRIGQRLAQASDRNYLNYHFYIFDESGMNAFSLPGGFIFVSRGIVEKTNEDELAFVLGHEIGHICARHSIKHLESSLGTSSVLELAANKVENDLLDKATDVVYNVISLGYFRGEEFMADSLAVRYTYKAGYSSHAGISLMGKLEKEGKNNYTMVFLRSHPPVKDRIFNINKKIEEVGSK